MILINIQFNFQAHINIQPQRVPQYDGIRSVNHRMVVTRAHVVTEVSSIQNIPLKAIQM